MLALLELDDALIGGKRGRGADGKTTILVACEHNNGRPSFVAMKAVDQVNQEKVKAFAQEAIAPGTDAFTALRVLAEGHHHVAKVTPPKMVDEWLLWVHVVISNFKSYVLGTYHGVSGRYMQEYLDEFCYHLNRRFWENQIPTAC
jgi:ISXO2-like transposase domain